MITAVDSSILFDVFQGNSDFGEASSSVLRQCIREGRATICDIVLAELAAGYPSRNALEARLEDMGVEFLPMTRESACLAGVKWKAYRERGGTRTRLIGDFLIAAHAQVQCDRLLTRDRGFYRTCFSELVILDPTA